MDSAADFERQVQSEIARLREDPVWKSRRVAIRLARVLAGFTLIAASFWVAEPIPHIAAKPIATLSLADIAGLVVRLLAAFWLLAGGFWTAFGEAPSREDLRAKAVEAVEERQLFIARLAAKSPETAREPSSDIENRPHQSKSPLVGRQCKQCGATYVSAQYCPKCRIRLAE